MPSCCCCLLSSLHGPLPALLGIYPLTLPKILHTFKHLYKDLAHTASNSFGWQICRVCAAAGNAFFASFQEIASQSYVFMSDGVKIYESGSSAMSTRPVGDELHYVLDCSHFGAIRAQFSNVFQDAGGSIHFFIWHKDKKICQPLLHSHVANGPDLNAHPSS